MPLETPAPDTFPQAEPALYKQRCLEDRADNRFAGFGYSKKAIGLAEACRTLMVAAAHGTAPAPRENSFRIRAFQPTPCAAATPMHATRRSRRPSGAPGASTAADIPGSASAACPDGPARPPVAVKAGRALLYTALHETPVSMTIKHRLLRGALISSARSTTPI